MTTETQSTEDTARLVAGVSADLEPHESIALTIALGQLHRGVEVLPNIASVCIFTLGRLAGLVGYDSDEATYSVYPIGKRPS